MAKQAPNTGTRPSRIQQKNRNAIMAAALQVFASQGFRGATLDQIAVACDMSKPNLLYYYHSKEEVYRALLEQLLDDWLAPLRQIDPTGDPFDEILRYAARKLQMSKEMPRQSRLFANEVLRGAPQVGPFLQGELKSLVDEKAAAISDWSARGLIAPLDPHHLIFSIWAITQHYADFDTQVRAILPHVAEPVDDAADFVATLIRKTLTP